jgi:hypothetical protein
MACQTQPLGKIIPTFDVSSNSCWSLEAGGSQHRARRAEENHVMETKNLTTSRVPED